MIRSQRYEKVAKVVVIGAGIGGLASAAILARAGLDVTVLEAQVYPGGCASTFYHLGYRFDTGATLAGGFYPAGPMDLLARTAGIDAWPTHPTDTAMLVHLPDGRVFPRRSGEQRWEDIQAAFGQPGLDFFRWQEATARAMWDLALDLPPWPPQSFPDLGALAAKSFSWLSRRNLSDHNPFQLAVDAFRPVAAHLSAAPEALRLLVDAQMLISAQTIGASANALYGAAALDLPNRGVVHLAGGMGAIAETLVQAIRRQGGRVLYRHEVISIHPERASYRVETGRGDSFSADLVIANLTPWNLAEVMDGDMPAGLRRLPERPVEGWGAFVVYVGLDGEAVPHEFPLHHQVVVDRPLGEGNSVFASLSPAWDASRAPAGQRALTLSTHTDLDLWQRLYTLDRPAYEAHKQALTEKMLAGAEIALPGLRSAARLVMPGTPITFQRFTRRKWGWVGGFPQTGLLRGLGPRLSERLWLVGDSIFPGQSSAAVALGGMRVAQAALKSLGAPASDSVAVSEIKGVSA